MAKDKTVVPMAGPVRNDTGVMRARDVRQALTGLVDPRVSAIIEKLAEINHGNMVHIASLASMFDQMVDTMQSITDIAQNMKDRTDQMSRAMQTELEGAPTDEPPSSH